MVQWFTSPTDVVYNTGASTGQIVNCFELQYLQ